MKNIKSNYILILIPLIIVILEILPFGAVCNFKSNEVIEQITYSYFNLTPFGYGNFAPFITAIFSCIILVLCTIFVVLHKSMLLYHIRNIDFITTIISIAPILLGINYISIDGVFISFLLFINLLLVQFEINKLPHD